MLAENERCSLSEEGWLSFRQTEITARISRVDFQYADGSDSGSGEIPADSATLDSGVESVRWKGSSGAVSVDLHWFFHKVQSHTEIQVELTSHAPGTLRFKTLRLHFEVVLPEREVALQNTYWYRNGWQSWSHAGVIPGKDATYERPRFPLVYKMKEDIAVEDAKSPTVSDMVGAIGFGNNAMCAGASKQRFFQRVIMVPTASGADLTLEFDLDATPVFPGDSRNIGGWQLQGGRTATHLVDAWGQRVGRKRPVQRPVVGWCSWYERKTHISQQFIQSTLDIIQSRPELKDLWLLQIDDGYQRHVGDWLTPHRRFKGTLEEIGGRIDAAGMTPGLWVSPFIAQSRSALFKKHRNWFLTVNGKPLHGGWNPHWKDSFYPLDLTHPEVLDWLFKMFSTLRGWGFRFFKLDYLYPAAWAGDRAHADTGRFEAFQHAVETIRRAVGEDSFLLGCGAPLAPSNGLFDGMRISCDTEYQWKNSRILQWVTRETETIGLFPAARNTLTRNPFARHFWMVDPDCLLIRRRSRKLTDSEVDLYSRLCMVSGEMQLIGDDLTRWSEEDYERFVQLQVFSGGDFIALDSADQPLPRWFRARNTQGPLVAAINLGEEDPMGSLAGPVLDDLVKVNGLIPLTDSHGSLGEDRINISPFTGHSMHLFQPSDEPIEGQSQQEQSSEEA